MRRAEREEDYRDTFPPVNSNTVRSNLSPQKPSHHKRPRPSVASPRHDTTLLPPILTQNASISLEERQARQMRSFLQNFLSDENGHFCKILDLHQHAMDTGITVTDATLQGLISTVPNVRGLRLSHCSAITDAGIWAIAQQCQALDTIYLAGCQQITELGLRVLVHNCRLITMDLSDCLQVNDTLLHTIAAGCWMLQVFILQRCQRITDAGIVKIAQCCKDLRHLDVAECEHVGEYGDKALIALGKYCPQLRILDLYGCRHVHDNGVKAIAKGCPLLTTLKLTGCRGVGSASLRALAKHCHALEVLSLAGCIQTTKEDLKDLARNCPQIQWLDISGSPNVDAFGVRALAQFCQSLSYLNLSNCPLIDDAALMELAVGTSTKSSLQQLGLANCPRITEHGVDLLTAACSNLLTLDMTECIHIGRRFLQKLVQKLEFVSWSSVFFGFEPLPNAAELVIRRDRRELEIKSAIKIQAVMRGCLARGGIWQAKLRFVERKVLPKIQARIRGFLVRKQLALKKQQQLELVSSGKIIQAYRNWRLRRLLARHRRLLRIRENESAAAIVFQKNFRGYRDRKRVTAMREEIQRRKVFEARLHVMLELAAIKVQRAYRGHRGRQDAAILHAAREAKRIQTERERQAATLLQRIYRGHQGRKSRAARMAVLLHEKKRNASATHVQRTFRGYKARRFATVLRAEAEILKRINAAMTIQRYWRGLKDKHLAAVLIGLVHLRAREEQAARTIQSAYRSYTSRGFMKAMRLAQQLQKRRQSSALMIQRVVRGHQGRAKAEVQRELRKLEVVARPLFQKEKRLSALVDELGNKVDSLKRKVSSDEADESLLVLELEKTMQIKTKYHDSSRITGTPQRYLTQYLQVQLADQLRARRVELAIENRALDTLLTQFNDVQKQLRGVKRELEPLSDGVVIKTREHRTKRLQTQVRRERLAAVQIQSVFRGYRIRCAVHEGANAWIQAQQTLEQGLVQTYYYNTLTGETRWHKPLAMDLFHDEFVSPLVVTETDGSSTREAVSSWYQGYDESVDQSYYFNAITKEYQWEKPDLVYSIGSMDSDTTRQRQTWLDQQLDGDSDALLMSSTLRAQLGEWEHRRDPISKHFFFYHPPSGEFRASLSPRSVNKSITTTSSSMRSARSIKTTTPKSTEWQYRYGYVYDSSNPDVLIPSVDDRPVWTEHMDESSGYVYYHNHVTDEYRWEKPPEFGMSFDDYAATTNTSRAWFQTITADPSDENHTSARELSARSTKGRTLGKKWIEYIDPITQNTYYYNEITGETRWSLSPRSARDTSDENDQISLSLFAQVKRLREEPVMYTSRTIHMEWLEAAMQDKDWKKVDAMVQQIYIREQSQQVNDAYAAAEALKSNIDTQQALSFAEPQDVGEKALPSGWMRVEATDVSDAYYYHIVTGETSWTRPDDVTSQLSTEARSDWQQMYDETSGAYYYFNTRNGETSWDVPH